MPPIPFNLTVTKNGAPAPNKSRAMHSVGEVVSVGKHHSGSHTEVRVVHGKRKKTTGKNSDYMFDDRPSTNIPVSNRHAKHFPVGKKVRMTVEPLDEDADDQGEE